MYDLEFMAALATSIVPPYHVEEVIAAWRDENIHHVEAGFVVRLRDGQYAYLTQHRGKKRHIVASSTEQFREEPTHLYDRGRTWEFDKEKLNGGTQVAKQTAKYPADSVSVGVDPRYMAGIGPDQPGVVGNLLHGPNHRGGSL